jgi:putative Holliday junction resolvase
MNQGRVLGIDPGDVRTGLAMSDDLRLMAHPLQTLRLTGAGLVQEIVNICRRHNVTAVVVGMPRNMDGSYGPAADKARELSQLLAAALAPVEVHPWDERLTTVAASKSLQQAGRTTRQQKNIVDQVAAQLILQGWLDARQ